MRTAAEVESLIARVDVVVTTRLHGLVLALKNGVPAVAVDPVRGGAKVCRQAQTLGWPYAYAVDEATPALLGKHSNAAFAPERGRMPPRSPPAHGERSRTCGRRSWTICARPREE